MFVTWGLYSVLRRRAWAMETEGIPVGEYEQLARQFTPTPNAARAWAKLARQAGQKYMVLTTKHHEGFCLFDTKYTNFCAPNQACGRDLVREFVNAARGEGLRVGLYYSLMDWHHPDAERCATDEGARKRYVASVHGQIRELMSNYGKIDILWYDVALPLDVKGWESERMNEMVFKLQPEIIVNDQNLLPGDFLTLEGKPPDDIATRAQETCMTMNESWGYQRADDNWKSPKTIIRSLVTCAWAGSNYLLNIGPRADGSIPEESVRILTAVGKWMGTNGSTIYKSEPCRVGQSNFAGFTRQGNTLYVHVHFWPGETFAIGGLQRSRVKSAELLASGKPVEFKQEEFRVQFTGLPKEPPDDPVTVLAVDFDSEPEQDTHWVRRERPRLTP